MNIPNCVFGIFSFLSKSHRWTNVHGVMLTRPWLTPYYIRGDISPYSPIIDGEEGPA